MFKHAVLSFAVFASMTSIAVAGDTSQKSSLKAQEKTQQAKGVQLPAVLQAVQGQSGVTVVKSFPAAGGLTGWVVKEKQSAKDVIVYTTADGEVLLAGMALDKNGQNLTNTYAEKHIPAPDYAPAYKAFTTEATSVTVGNSKAKAEITVVFDANCGYCKLMHRLVQPSIENGDLRVRYVPVAILGRDSDTKAAGLLASKDAKEFIDADATGGTIQTSDDKSLLTKVQNNTALMHKYGFNGTPVVLYKARDKKGEDTLFVAPGLPTVSEMFTRLGIDGNLDKLREDPSLKNYAR